MGILYLVQRKISLSNPDGVCKKILQQIKVFTTIDDCYLLGYSEDSDIALIYNNTYSILAYHNHDINLRDSLYNCAIKLYKEKDIKILYFRYSICDYKLIKFLSITKDRNINIISEIATYPYRKEANGIRLKLIYNLVDRFYCTQLHKYVSRILTYSNDEQIFGIPCINTYNGIIVDEIKPKNTINDNEEIHLIAVSSMEKWHGYERILYGLNTYYNNTSHSAKVIFDIVGDGSERKKYEEIVNNLNLHNYVNFFGFKTGKELDDLYDQATIGIGTLSFYKIGVRSSSALKTREYLAKGIPIVSGSLVVGLPEEYYAVMYCEENDNPINIEEIISFYHRVYQNKTSIEVVNLLRNDAKKYFDLYIMLDELINYMNSILKSK